MWQSLQFFCREQSREQHRKQGKAEGTKQRTAPRKCIRVIRVTGCAPRPPEILTDPHISDFREKNQSYHHEGDGSKAWWNCPEIEPEEGAARKKPINFGSGEDDTQLLFRDATVQEHQVRVWAQPGSATLRRIPRQPFSETGLQASLMRSVRCEAPGSQRAT